MLLKTPQAPALKGMGRIHSELRFHLGRGATYPDVTGEEQVPDSKGTTGTEGPTQPHLGQQTALELPQLGFQALG